VVLSYRLLRGARVAPDFHSSASMLRQRAAADRIRQRLTRSPEQEARWLLVVLPDVFQARAIAVVHRNGRIERGRSTVGSSSAARRLPGTWDRSYITVVYDGRTTGRFSFGCATASSGRMGSVV
jgi:hypothetical protein